jgi:hypothetical protein
LMGNEDLRDVALGGKPEPHDLVLQGLWQIRKGGHVVASPYPLAPWMRSTIRCGGLPVLAGRA